MEHLAGFEYRAVIKRLKSAAYPSIGRQRAAMKSDLILKRNSSQRFQITREISRREPYMPYCARQVLLWMVFWIQSERMVFKPE